MRVLTRRLFPLRLAVLSLLATLLLSGSAQAFGSEATGGGESSEVSGSKPVSGESSETAKSGLGETETPTPPNPVPIETPMVPIETPIPPVSTETTLPPVTSETPPPVPVETTTLPVLDAPTEPTSPVVTETLEAPTRKLPPPEGPSTRPIAGEAAANSSVVFAAESRPADMAPAVVASLVPSASSEPIGAMLTRSTAGARPKTPADLGVAAFSSIPGELLATAQTSGGASCKVSSLQDPMTETCSEAWLGTQRLISTSTGRIDSTTSLRRSTAGGATGGGGGGFTGPSHPVSPPPGPAPSGASGASGAGGGSGPAPSAFLTLAGLLLLAAPRALRRLRLSCEPWLTAFFVLIPERPG